MYVMLNVRKDEMMTRQTAWIMGGIFAALILASGCATVDYVADAPSIVKAADWSKMETVDVVLEEYAYRPGTLVFKKDVPGR